MICNVEQNWRCPFCKSNFSKISKSEICHVVSEIEEVDLEYYQTDEEVNLMGPGLYQKHLHQEGFVCSDCWVPVTHPKTKRAISIDIEMWEVGKQFGWFKTKEKQK